MSFVTVTRKENVQTITEDGEIVLNNEAEIGHLRKLHSSVVQGVDDNNQPQLGFLVRAEVYWEHKRTPSPALEDPNELVWLTLPTNETEADDYEEDFETEDYETEADSHESLS